MSTENAKEETKINCLTFQKQEPIIKELTDKVNQTEDLLQKIRYAQELLKESQVLLACPKYKEENLYCWNCYTVAGLRKAVAELIIKTKKL